MIPYLGDFKAGQTVRYWWSTAGANGASITRATNGTLLVYRGSSATERTSSAGITDTEDFDLLTGVHLLAIDLSNNSDAGFYDVSNDYVIVLAGATIDGQTVNAPIACFSIENRIVRSDVIQVGGQPAQSTTDPVAANVIQISGQSVTGGAVPATISGTVAANVVAVDGQSVAGGAVPATLVPTGLDAISVADPGGVATMNTLPRQVGAIWRRFFKKVVKNDTAIAGYADDGTTLRWSQSYTDDGAQHETLEAAS